MPRIAGSTRRWRRQGRVPPRAFRSLALPGWLLVHVWGAIVPKEKGATSCCCVAEVPLLGQHTNQEKAFLPSSRLQPPPRVSYGQNISHNQLAKGNSPVKFPDPASQSNRRVGVGLTGG